MTVFGDSGTQQVQTMTDDGSFRDFTSEERWALVEHIETLK